MQNFLQRGLYNVLLQFWYYYLPILLVVGTIANFLCIFVTLRTELKNMVSRYYFIAMTICNEAQLLWLGVTWIVAVNDRYGLMKDIYVLSVYLPMGLQFLSMYFVLAFMIERYRAVRFPPYQQNIKSTKIITLGITIAGIMLPVVIFLIHGRNYHWEEFWDHSHSYTFINVIETIISNVGPCIAIIVLSIRISTMTRGPATMGGILTNPTNGTTQVPIDQQNSSTISVKEMRITKMLLIVAVTFGCTNLISRLIDIFFLIEHVWVTGTGFLILTHISNFLSSTILAMNLFSCCAVNREFRQATFATICCRRQTHYTVPQTVLYTHVNPEANVTPLITSGTGV